MRQERDALEGQVAQLESRVARGEYNPATTKVSSTTTPARYYLSWLGARWRQDQECIITYYYPAGLSSSYSLSSSSFGPHSRFRFAFSDPPLVLGTCARIQCPFSPLTLAPAPPMAASCRQVLHVAMNPQQAAIEAELVCPLALLPSPCPSPVFRPSPALHPAFCANIRHESHRLHALVSSRPSLPLCAMLRLGAPT